MAELKNQFTWSASRRSSFAYCARQYWWTYYGSWGGWDRNAPAETREAYILKNLANRWMWVGTVVHETIESILRRLHARAVDEPLGFDDGPLDVDAEIEGATQRMRAQWVESREGHYRRRPKRAFGLLEHEYEEPVPREAWQAANRKMRDGLRAFLTSDLFGRIQASNPRRWLPIETLDRFDFEGTDVWAVLDFAFEREDGAIEIFDWKTGEVKPDADRLQLACYALYVQAARDVPAESVTTHLVYLGETLQQFTFQMTERDVRDAQGEMRASIAAMRTRLRDGEANVAVREDFPLHEDTAVCRACAYRRLCGRG